MRVLNSRSVYKGRIIELEIDRIIEPQGVEAEREVVRHPGSVVVLPRFPGSRILLVRQFRYAARRSLWELVAGSLGPRESAVKAAARELREETGYSAAKFRLLFRFYSSPGFLDEKMHLFEALDLRSGDAMPERDERIEARLFSLSELREMIAAGKIQDGKTLVGLLWLLAKTRLPR
ncbi:MAG: NUDIX hydrolase [Terriglobia bacterium]